MKLNNLADAFNKADDWLYEKMRDVWVGFKTSVGLAYMFPTTMRYLFESKGPQAYISNTRAATAGVIVGAIPSLPILITAVTGDPVYAAGGIVTQSISVAHELGRAASKEIENAKASL